MTYIERSDAFNDEYKKTYKVSALMMQLLRDNITMWGNDTKKASIYLH